MPGFFVHTQSMERDRLPRRHVRTGPLPCVPWSSLDPTIRLEQRLPLAFMFAFLLLLAIQGWLHA